MPNLLTTSTILSMDIIRPLAGLSIPEKTLLLLSRVLIIVMGIFSLLVALTLKGVIPSLLLGYTIYTSGLVLPILLGFYRDKLGLNRAGAILAMVVGGGLALIGQLMGVADSGLHGFFLSGLILIMGSRLFRLFGMGQ